MSITKEAQAILQTARVAEMRMAADEVAALCKPRPAVVLPRRPHAVRRRLLALLVSERRRSAKLVDLIR